MANVNLKINPSNNLVSDGLCASVLFDIAFDNGFQKISEYLGENLADVSSATKSQAELIIKSVSEKATCNKQTLVSLMSFLKFIHENDGKLARVVPIRKYDRHADRGMEFLLAVFGAGLNKEIDLLNSKSSLKEDSNFTLVTIIASYLLKRINLKLINSNFETFELFELLKNSSKSNSNSGSILFPLQGPEVSKNSHKLSKFWLLSAFFLPMVILIFYVFDFAWGVNERGQLSKISFSENTTSAVTHLNPVQERNDILKKGIQRIFRIINQFMNANDSTTNLQTVTNRAADSVSLTVTPNVNKIIGDSSDSREIDQPTPNSPVSAVVFGFNKEKESEGIGKSIKEKTDIEVDETKKSYRNQELIHDLKLYLRDVERKKATFLLGGVNFNFNQIGLTENARQILQETASFLKNDVNNFGYTLVIVGHTDSYGDDFVNRRLSLERAAIARKIFIDNGIDEKKVVTRGVGSDFPSKSNSTNDGRSLNRRLTLEIHK